MYYRRISYRRPHPDRQRTNTQVSAWIPK